MIGTGREEFPEAFCPSLEDRQADLPTAVTQSSGEGPRIPGRQERPGIKYVINMELGQVNTVRAGGLHIPHVCPGSGPWPSLFPELLLLAPEMLLPMATGDRQPGS